MIKVDLLWWRIRIEHKSLDICRVDLHVCKFIKNQDRLTFIVIFIVREANLLNLNLDLYCEQSDADSQFLQLWILVRFTGVNSSFEHEHTIDENCLYLVIDKPWYAFLWSFLNFLNVFFKNMGNKYKQLAPWRNRKLGLVHK